MKVRRIEFIWKKIANESFNFGGIDEIKISIFEKASKIIVEVIAGDLKIIDGTIMLDTNYILKQIGKIDFDDGEKGRDFEFFKYMWQLAVNDNVYSGVFQCPGFVSKVKKIIRFDTILILMNKKVADYSKKSVNNVPSLND